MNNSPRTYFITRHSGARAWAARHGYQDAMLLAHLDPAGLAALQPGDCVLGTLPVHLAGQVCARGGHYFHLSIDIPPEARGRDLDADDMERFGARLEEFVVRRIA
jgi:CRISPR-associated protein Csx16